MNWAIINDEYNNEIIQIENKSIKDYNLDNNIEVIEENEENEILDTGELVIEEIIKIDINAIAKYNPLEIIKMQIKIIDHVIKYYKLNKILDSEFYITFFKWLYMTSEYLSYKIKQPIHKNKSNNLLRSSYKFCNKKADCCNQYGFLFNRKPKNCINDHYVHHKIVSDIDNLIFYLNKNSPNIEQDMRKGLETINYVLNHMYQELSSFMVYFDAKTSRYTINDFYRYYNRN